MEWIENMWSHSKWFISKFDMCVCLFLWTELFFSSPKLLVLKALTTIITWWIQRQNLWEVIKLRTHHKDRAPNRRWLLVTRALILVLHLRCEYTMKKYVYTQQDGSYQESRKKSLTRNKITKCFISDFAVLSWDTLVNSVLS